MLYAILVGLIVTSVGIGRTAKTLFAQAMGKVSPQQHMAFLTSGGDTSVFGEVTPRLRVYAVTQGIAKKVFNLAVWALFVLLVLAAERSFG